MTLNDELKTGTTCETICVHHPDCECQTCRAHKDAVCGKPAVGLAQTEDDSWLVCEDCAASADRDPEAEGVVTRFDVASATRQACRFAHNGGRR